MALPKVIIATLVAFTLNFFPAHANECVSLERYHSVLSSQGVKLYGSKADATRKLETVFNENRAKMGRAKVEVSVFLVGYLKAKDGDFSVVVAVFDNSGCLVEDALVAIPLKMWVEFFLSAGVDLSDFVEVGGA